MAATARPTPRARSPTARRSRAIPTRARFLDRNDSYHYFEPLGDLVITGPTNTNVMDVRLILVGVAKVSFWRKEVIEPALDQETQRHIEEQRAWIVREPANAKPYYHLAQLYRVAFKQDEALGLLLEAVRLDPAFADAHASLAEIYVLRDDFEPPGGTPASPNRTASRAWWRCSSETE